MFEANGVLRGQEPRQVVLGDCGGNESFNETGVRRLEPDEAGGLGASEEAGAGPHERPMRPKLAPDVRKGEDQEIN